MSRALLTLSVDCCLNVMSQGKTLHVFIPGGHEEIKDGVIAVASRSTIQFWASRFDMILMLYRRQLMTTSGARVVWHGEANSSNQRGFNYLCAREEQMLWGNTESFEIPGRPLLGGFKLPLRNLPTASAGIKKSAVADKDYPPLLY